MSDRPPPPAALPAGVDARNGRLLAASAQASEARIALWVLGAASGICALAWAVEMGAGVITPWDRWLVPTLAVLFAGCAAWIHRRPLHTLWPRALACLALNAYLVTSNQLQFHTTPDATRLYQLLTGLYWLPLGYAMAFIFLPTRVAVAVSSAVFASMYLPLGLALQTPRGQQWGPEFAALVGMTGLAQVAYIVVLAAVATMRMNYHRAHERLKLTEELVNTDLLTGLKSRRASEAALLRAIEACAADGRPLTVMLIDIDHFKRINDTHGHAAGDRTLTDLGRVLATQLRATDHVGRWGGEEFLVVAPSAGLEVAAALGERLRDGVASTTFAHGQPVTISIGLTLQQPGDHPHLILARADQALYRAKMEGRNRLAVE